MRIITGSRVGLYRLHYLRLIATLEASLDLRNSPATMTSTLDELSMLEITPPSSPKIDAKENKRHNRTKPANLTRKESLPSKFLNRPPEPLYYFEDGLRKIPPYHYTYNTYCKERWRGRTLLDIFVKEFRDRPEEYYVRGSFVIFFLVYKNKRKLDPENFRAKSYPSNSRKKPLKIKQSQYLEKRTAETLLQNN